MDWIINELHRTELERLQNGKFEKEDFYTFADNYRLSRGQQNFLLIHFNVELYSDYYLHLNGPAGEYIVTDSYQSPTHFTFCGRYATEGELEEAIKELAGDDVYAVFYSAPEHDGYITVENKLTGNWKGSRETPYSYQNDFPTREEAEQYLGKLLQDSDN